MTTKPLSLPKFSLGRVVVTTIALDALAKPYPGGEIGFVSAMLARHLSGDWGVICDEDKASNDEALEHGSRILSAYPIDPSRPSIGFGENTLWIITEADRSSTTILLPTEY